MGMESSWHSYPSIYNIGHRALADLFNHPVNVEEKVDGSQFSFGVFDTPEGRVLRVRSKGAEMIPDAPEKMFTKAVESVRERVDHLVPGWTYRGEYLRVPKHNTLIYNRTPVGHIILFDINTQEEGYLSYEDKQDEAARLGLEVVPRLYTGTISTAADLRHLLDHVSVLGGQKIEGIVVKPQDYNVYGRDKKVLMGKFVSEAFKEVHSHAWKEANPGPQDIINTIGGRLTTQARWAKAVQHLRERGTLTDSPQDIGTLMREIPEDIKREEEGQIKEWLFAWAWPHIRRQTTKGFPEWYKEELVKLQFERPEQEGAS